MSELRLLMEVEYPEWQRFREYIGTENKQTYALHLEEWLSGFPGNVVFEYLIFGDKVNQFQMQVIEDSLWDYFLPVAGKKGAYQGDRLIILFPAIFRIENI